MAKKKAKKKAPLKKAGLKAKKFRAAAAKRRVKLLPKKKRSLKKALPVKRWH